MADREHRTRVPMALATASLLAACATDEPIAGPTGVPDPPPKKVRVVSDIGQVGPDFSSHPTGFVRAGARMFFDADAGSGKGGTGIYFYEIDPLKGPVVQRVPDWGGEGIVASSLTAHEDFCYFVEDGTKLWRTDGKAPAPIASAASVYEFPPILGLAESGTWLYALTVDPDESLAIWRVDHASASAEQVAVTAGGSGTPIAGTFTDCDYDAGGMLAFGVLGDDGITLWNLQGPTFGKLPVVFGSLGELVAVDSSLYFAAGEGLDLELWHFDGSVASQVQDELTEAPIRQPAHMVAQSPYLFFTVHDGLLFGDKPMRAYGATAEASEFFTGGEAYAIEGMLSRDGQLWMLAVGSTGNSLWRIAPATNEALALSYLPGSEDAGQFVTLQGGDQSFCFCSTTAGGAYQLIEHNYSKGTTATIDFDGLAPGEKAHEVTPFGEHLLLRAEHSTKKTEPWHYPDPYP